MSTKNRIKIGATAALFALAGAAVASPLTLSGPITGNTVGPQSASNPCIIAGTTCQQPASMGYNNYTTAGNITSFNMYSTTPTATVADGVQGTPYTVAQLIGALGTNSFNIAIDVNTTGAASEVLNLFEVIINGAVAYNYNGNANIGNVNNNGNGYADYTLNTVSLAGLAPTATVLFHAIWTNAVDGAESFFLVAATPTNLPEPGSLALLGVVLGGIGVTARRKARA